MGKLGFGRSTAGGGGKVRSGTESGGKLGGSALWSWAVVPHPCSRWATLWSSRKGHVLVQPHGPHSVPHPYPSSAILKAKPHFAPLNDMETVSWEAKQLAQSEISAQITRTQVLGWAHHQALPTGTGSGEGGGKDWGVRRVGAQGGTSLLTAWDVEEPSPPTANPMSHKVHGQLGLQDTGGTFLLSKAALTTSPCLALCNRWHG